METLGEVAGVAQRAIENRCLKHHCLGFPRAGWGVLLVIMQESWPGPCSLSPFCSRHPWQAWEWFLGLEMF